MRIDQQQPLLLLGLHLAYYNIMSEAFVPEQPQQQWTEEETEVFKLAFDLFDQNGDGFIDLEELDTGFIELGQKQRRSMLVRMIETVDENQDHKIDFKEFIELMKLRQLDDQLRKELDATNREEGDEEGQALEELLMSRFGNMSLNEDIRRGSLYGRLAATDETPQAIVKALKEMDVQIGKIPDKKKTAYLQAKEQCALLMGDKFMLMFLRADRFIAKASDISKPNVLRYTAKIILRAILCTHTLSLSLSPKHRLFFFRMQLVGTWLIGTSVWNSLVPNVPSCLSLKQEPSRTTMNF